MTNETQASDNLFAGSTTPAQQPSKTEDQAPSLVTALVGETQKYKSVEELAKGYTNAEEFINRLKEENAELRKQTAQAKSLDDVLAKLSERNARQEDNLGEGVPAGLSADAIAQIVQQQITGIESAKARQSNLDKADKAMKEKFGEKAAEVFAQAAATPELRDVYTKLAAADPDKFVSLFSSQQGSAPQGNTSVETSNVNTAGAFNANPRVEQWSKEWITNVRKSDPKKYWSTEFQYAMSQNITKRPDLYFKS